MDINELWIGDGIMSTKSGITGTFEGMKDGKVRLKSKGKVTLVPPKYIVQYEKKEVKTLIDTVSKKYSEEQFVGDTIDLHMERLNPTMSNANPIHILEYQIRKCKSFLNYIIRNRKLKAVIIHGIGTGQLKQEVVNICGDYKEIIQVNTVNNGGAQELHLTYY